MATARERTAAAAKVDPTPFKQQRLRQLGSRVPVRVRQRNVRRHPIALGRYSDVRTTLSRTTELARKSIDKPGGHFLVSPWRDPCAPFHPCAARHASGRISTVYSRACRAQILTLIYATIATSHAACAPSIIIASPSSSPSITSHRHSSHPLQPHIPSI
jgi:hypothetical protein